MPEVKRSPLARYGVAVLAVVLATLIRAPFSPLFGAEVPFLFYFPAIVFAGWYGRFGPGLLATLLSALFSLYFFIKPTFSFSVADSSAAVQIIVFIMTGIFISALSKSWHRSKQQVEEVTRALEVKEEEERRRAEKALKASEERFSKAFNLNPQPLSIRTLDGRIIDVNDGFLRLTGYSREEVLGRTATDLKLWTAASDRAQVMTSLQEQKMIRDLELRFRVKGGEERVCLFSAEIIHLDGQPYILAATTDITERKRAEEEREQLLAREQAARKEAEQSEALSAELLVREQAARAQAEQSSRIKDEFLATVSHELRTPLNAMLGWAGMLLSGKLDPASSTRALETIERNAKAQAQLIEDMLDVSRIITGKLRLYVRPIRLQPVIQAAVDVIRPAADAKDIRIKLSLDPDAGTVSGDPDRLQQVVWNLVSNAVKFSFRGGEIQVGVKRAGSHLEIAVSDTGQGIVPEFLPYVFDRFRQADSSISRRHTGLGLGLAIVRHLVELHGGTVQAASGGQGQGARFTVELPLAAVQDISQSEADSAESELQSKALLSGMRLLVVDNDADARNLLALLLEKSGAEVRTAGSAAEALGALREWRADVLVSDIEMPGEDGYSLIRKVRLSEERSVRLIPAIALTAHARDVDRRRALSAGFESHVAKPVSPQELIEVIVGLARREKSV